VVAWKANQNKVASECDAVYVAIFLR